MNDCSTEYLLNGYRIRVNHAWDTPEFLQKLQNLSPENLQNAKILHDGRHRVYRAKMSCGDTPCDVVVKTFGRQAVWRDYIAKRGKGSKAYRAFKTAALLQEKSVGTPAPIAVVERWNENRLVESHFICEYVPGLSDFRVELDTILHKTRDCTQLMDLIEPVAKAVRKLHDAGVIHRDLGNQNIGLSKNSDGSWKVWFIDLNRARIFPKLTDKLRGKDLARLDIPSAFFSEFLNIYGASQACRKEQEKALARFELHTKLRPFRHPIREYRLRKQDGGRLFFSASAQREFRRNIWIWDERSAQTVPAFNSKDRRRMRTPSNIFSALREWLKHGYAIQKKFKALQDQSFAEKVPFENTIGMALDPNPETWTAQLNWLNELQGAQKIPVLLRVYHHKGEAHWCWVIEQAKELHAAGHIIAFALVQDRNAILKPASWKKMCDLVFSNTHSFADVYEIGHVTNRGKWGVWDFREYQALIAPALEAQKRFPKIKLSGPACIDFDLHSLPALLGEIPPGTFDALSQHLYVDRRGAPENKQGKFDTVDKCALHRAFARVYGFREEKIIVSEVNWPVVGTGHWSPVGSPYTLNGPWATPPSATEEDYAKFMCRYLLLAIASGHVSRVYWWRLAARGYGLIDDTGTPEEWRARPAFFALKDLLATLAGTRFERRLTDVPEGSFALEFSRADGSRFTLRWTLDSLPEII